MRLRVKIPHLPYGSNYKEFSCDDAATLLALKRKLHELTPVSADDQQIFFSGKLLFGGDKTLKSFGIVDNATLRMSPRPKVVVGLDFGAFCYYIRLFSDHDSF